ncbi:MAG TPA: SMC-Scp complex subunit ScpB [Firmicutes bacterium]|nr:SMC-Scp complex subunit ScpB [Bacillota bacterium]
MNLIGVLEGLLFAVGDEGLTLKSLSDILGVTNEEAKNLLMELKKRYETPEYGIRISYMGDAFKLTTKKEHKEYYQKLLGSPESQSLSESALEVLAIVAYNQPISRVMVDEMRGVACGQIMRKLCARGLLKIVGKSKMAGRPNLYGTTKEFLDYFGLASIDDLPKIEVEESETDEETELFTSIYKEEQK